MDYKELIERLNTGEFDRDYECTLFECGVFSLTREAATSITDLLARAEAAEARAEKAERERDEYFKHLQGFCFCCAHRTDGFDCKAKCYGHKRGSAWVYAGAAKEE